MNAQPLINPDDPKYRLHVESMDQTHVEFIDLVNRLAAADKNGFAELILELVSHTEAHFEAERQLMLETGFPAIREHQSEHERVLGEMHRFSAKAAAGSTMMARAYVKEQLPPWFALHAATMDSALAAHIRGRMLMPTGS